MTQTWPRAPGIITRCNSELERTRSLEHRYRSHDRREMWGDNGKEVTQGSGWQRWGHPGTPVSPSPSPVAQTPFPPVRPTWAPSNFLPISTCSWSSAGWKSSPAWNWVLSIDTHSLHFVFVVFFKINIYIFLKDLFSRQTKQRTKQQTHHRGPGAAVPLHTPTASHAETNLHQPAPDCAAGVRNQRRDTGSAQSQTSPRKDTLKRHFSFPYWLKYKEQK